MFSKGIRCMCNEQLYSAHDLMLRVSANRNASGESSLDTV